MVRYSAIILVKTWWKSVEWCLRYSAVFSVFCSRWHISIWKIETTLRGDQHSCRTFFIHPEYIDHSPQNCLELVEQFARKLIIRKKTFWEKKINLYYPHTSDWRSIEILRPSLIVCLIRSYFELLAFKNSRPWKCRSRSQCTTFAVIVMVMFCIISHRLRDSRKKRKMSKRWPWSWRSR